MRLGHILPYASAMANFSSSRFGFLDSCYGHILSCASVIINFSSHGSGFPDSHLRHILPCGSTITDFSSRGLGFSDLCTSGTFCLMPLLWLISPQVGWIFSIHMPWVHFALYLHSKDFSLYRSSFFRLMHIRYIFPCAFVMTDFSLRGLSFLDSCASCIFYLIPLLWWISPHGGQVFLTRASLAHFALCLHHSGYLLTWVEFFFTHVPYLFYLIPPP